MNHKPIVNALTIDVEEYFQVHAFSGVVSPNDWGSFESRVVRNTLRILDLLDSVNHHEASAVSCELGGGGYKPRATFFVLGWIAEHYPGLIKEIHKRGHEIASHGYLHQSILGQSRDKFAEDVSRAKGILEDLTGVEVIGYRAPTYSITKETLWALEILIELGFRYDSSIFPIKHDFYGYPEAPRFPFCLDLKDSDLLSQFKNPKYLHEMKNQDLSAAPCAVRPGPSLFIEFPLSTITLLGRNLPCSGGGYFRLFPYWYTKWGFNKLNNNGSQPAIFYIHPWELDPNLPRINSASRLSKFRTYVNLKDAKGRFIRLLKEFRFVPLARML